MSLFSLSMAYLRRNALMSLLTLTLLAVGISAMTLILLVSHQFEQRLQRDADGIDLVVGAKGSPLQIILSSVFHVDVPTGNIPLDDARWVAEHPLVAATIPLALGDSYRGLRIVGTSHAYVQFHDAALARGALWDDTHGAVLGARAARDSGLDVGDVFHGAHGITSDQASAGFVHADHPYRVTGVLRPTGTVIDRLILVSVESVWEVHSADGHWSRRSDVPQERYLTALLVQYRSPLAAAMLPRLINSRNALQAASPAYEIARLSQLVGVGLGTLRLMGLLLIALGALGIFAALYAALRDRRQDIAVMRVLGASRGRVTRLLLMESLLLTTAALVVGTALAYGLLGGASALASVVTRWQLTPWVVLPEQALIVVGAWSIGLVAAAIPAWRAYRVDVARVLQQARGR